MASSSQSHKHGSASAPVKLRKGASGPEVFALQERLSDLGYYFAPSGHFGDLTDWALRDFQRKQGLPATGVVNQQTKDELDNPGTAHAHVMETIGQLHIAPAAMLAAAGRRNVQYSKHPHMLSVSTKMSNWLYSAEAGDPTKESRHLYWPGGSSGVTIGAGYDMGGRKQVEVAHDLMAIGVDAETAGKAAKGAGKEGPQSAKTFVDANKDLLDLTPEQQRRLFDGTLPKYEGYVRSSVHVDLVQHEFDALVSFAFNAGSGPLVTVGHKIDAGEIVEALQHMETILTRKAFQFDRTRLALAHRRRHEITYYLTGEFSN